MSGPARAAPQDDPHGAATELARRALGTIRQGPYSPSPAALDALEADARFVLTFAPLAGHRPRGYGPEMLDCGAMLSAAGALLSRRGGGVSFRRAGADILTSCLVWGDAGLPVRDRLAEVLALLSRCGVAPDTRLSKIHKALEGGASPDELVVRRRFSESVSYPYLRENLCGDGEEDLLGALDLDRDGLGEVRAAVDRGDREAALPAYRDILRRRLRELGLAELGPWRVANRVEADEICRNVLTLRAHMLVRHDFGDEVDWEAVLFDDVESNVSLNCHAPLHTLAAAFLGTGEDRYARQLARLFNAWYRSRPRPQHLEFMQWRTLEAGNRCVFAWPVLLAVAARSDAFAEAALLDLARAYLAAGRYLQARSAAGGNWLQVECSGLAAMGSLFPEFTDAALALDVALARLRWINDRVYLPDGMQSECTPGYHAFPTGAQLRLAWLARAADRPLPDELMSTLKSACDVFVKLAMPDGHLPALSDFNPGRMRAKGLLSSARKVFDDPRYDWFATDGETGRPPAPDSATLAAADVEALAEWVLVSRDPAGQVRRVRGLNVGRLSVAGRTLVAEDRPVRAVDVALP
jgi:hypothetical protein